MRERLREARIRAITRQTSPQIGQSRLCTMLINQSRQAGAAMSLAATAADFEQFELADKLAERE
jgi:hypothetical protein